MNYAFFFPQSGCLDMEFSNLTNIIRRVWAVIEAKQRLEEVTENLPATRSYIELEYQAIIQNMYKKMIRSAISGADWAPGNERLLQYVGASDQDTDCCHESACAGSRRHGRCQNL